MTPRQDLERMLIADTPSRREFLRRLAGGVVSAGLPILITGCPRNPGSTPVPAACPVPMPMCRVLAAREKTAGGMQSLWSTTRDLSMPASPWSTMTAATPPFMPPGFWDVRDLDEITIPQGSVVGCDETHTVMVISEGPGGLADGELLYKRQRTDGTWDNFTSLSAGLGGTSTPSRPFRFSRVAAARVGANLHVCGVTTTPVTGTAVDPGKLLHGVRVYDGGGAPEIRMWTPTGWDDVGTLTTSALPPISDVGCAGVKNPATGMDELHVCVVTNDGHLLHSIQTGPTSWLPFGDIGAQAGNVGPFTRVACAADAGQLHVVAITTHGRAMFTIRNATAWRPFEDVMNAASSPLSQLGQSYNVGVGFCNDGLPSGQTQLHVVVAMDYGAGLHYTVRSNQPIAWQPVSPTGPRQWKPWTNLETESGYTDGGSFVAACVGSRPRAP